MKLLFSAVLVACVLLQCKYAAAANSAATALRGLTLRAYYLDDGVELVRNADGSLGGWMWYVAQAMEAGGGFKIVDTPLPAAFLANYSSPFGACPVAVSLGLVDLCIGSLWETTSRELICSFSSAVRVASFFLATPIDFDNTAAITKVLIPFEYNLWAALVLVMFIEGMAMWLIERNASDDFPEDVPPTKQGRVTLFLAAFGFLSGGPAHTPRSTAGQFVSVGYAFLILIVLASYTANLAVFLTASNTASAFTTLDYASQNGITICIPSDIQQEVGATNSASLSLLGYDVQPDEMVGFLAGACGGAVVEANAFDGTQTTADSIYCNYARVGSPVAQVPVSFAVADAYQHGISYQVAQLRFSGVLDQLWTQYSAATSNCTVPETDGRVQVSDMTGAFVIMAACTGAGLLVWASKLVLDKCLRNRKGDGGNNPSSSVVPTSKELQLFEDNNSSRSRYDTEYIGGPFSPATLEVTLTELARSMNDIVQQQQQQGRLITAIMAEQMQSAKRAPTSPPPTQTLTREISPAQLLRTEAGLVVF